MSYTAASIGNILFRLAIVVAFVVLATWAGQHIRDALDFEIRPQNEQQIHQMIMVGSVAYIALLALPFVPGAEIGLAMLAGFGPGIAPLIYVCTVASMLLAYVVGRFLPITLLQRFFSFLHMRRAADLIARAAPLSGEERLALLLDGQPKRALSFGLKYRYVALALAVNTPGNSLIGGGGGIMMLAGLSGVFSPLPTFLAIAIAVSPVPLAVMFFGLQL